MNKRICLHTNNWAILGGIESLVMDFARVFPQYQHVLVTINTRCENLDFVKHIQDQGIRYMNADGKLTKAIVESLDPAMILLHNTRGEHIEGEWPYEWLRKWRVIGVHHASTWPLVSSDCDWFVSNYVRKYYEKCEPRMKAFTMPPCVLEDQYLGVERNGRQPVVGRIQSGTNLQKGKFPPKFFSLLEKVDGCDFFIVTSDGLAKMEGHRERFKFAPIKPGAMAGYLKEVDIFAMWGDTKETWSRVVTEANLSGIPVVARNHRDGLAEQIKGSGGGILVDTQEDFVDMIQMLVDDPDRRTRIGEQGRQWCLEHASSKALKERFLETFLEWSLS